MKIKLPFKFGKVIFEKDVELTFKLAALEVATLDILGCDLWGVSEFPIEQVNTAILFAAYVTACKDKYHKPKYSLSDAEFWISHMNKDSQLEFAKAIAELMGSMKKTEGKEEKKK